MEWLTAFTQDLQLSAPALMAWFKYHFKSGDYCHHWWDFHWHAVGTYAFVFN